MGRSRGGGCEHTSRIMVAYVSTADAAHTAAFWCAHCGALGWTTYEKGSAERWQLPERPKHKRRRR